MEINPAIGSLCHVFKIMDTGAQKRKQKIETLTVTGLYLVYSATRLNNPRAAYSKLLMMLVLSVLSQRKSVHWALGSCGVTGEG